MDHNPVKIGLQRPIKCTDKNQVNSHRMYLLPNILDRIK